MYCIKCGAQIPDNCEFCSYCGNRVGGFDTSKVPNPYSQKNSFQYRTPAKSPGATIGAVISAIIAIASLFLLVTIPKIAKSDRSSTGMMSAWAFEYQWGERFLFSCGAIFVISMLVAIGLCIYNGIKK